MIGTELRDRRSTAGQAADTPARESAAAVTDDAVPLVPSPQSNVAGTHGLHPQFPGGEPGTGVVLYGSRPGLLRAHWRLAPDDRRRADGSFPSGGGHPRPVVQLRRVHPGGGAELVDEASLSAVVREGAGETAFAVAADHGRYRAELGLTTGDGGWLLLARSNDLDNVSPVGIALRRRATAPRPHQGARLTVGEPEPTLVPPSPGSLAEVFPLVTVAAPGDGSTPLDAAGRPWLTEVAVSPLGQREGLAVADAGPAGPTQRALEGRPVRLPPPGTPRVGSDARSRIPSPDLPPIGSKAPADPPTFAPITPLTYGLPASAVAVVQVEAELRITGQAAPGSLIDLFGQPFRVGPGGRFQLVVRVDDPALLRLALALNPPPELALTRDP